MEETPTKILEHLKTNGKTSGGQVKEKLRISDSEFRKAKDWLKENGLIVTGRGRGGTLEAIEGAVEPPEAKKLSQAEVMAIAREERERKSHRRKVLTKIEEAAMELAKKEHPDADKIEVQIWDADKGHVYIYPWYGKSAVTHEAYVEI